MLGRNRLGTVRFGRAFAAEGTLYTKTIATATSEVIGTTPRKPGKRLSAASEVLGSTIRPLAVGRALAGTSTASGTVPRSTSKIVGLGSSEAVGTVTRHPIWSKVLAVATSEVVGTVGRSIGNLLVGAVGTAGTVGRAMARTITGTASTVGTVPRAITKTVATATAATVGAVRRAVAKTIATGTAEVIGTVARGAAHFKALAVATATAIGLSIRPLTVGKVPDTTVGTVGTMRPISVTRAIATAVVSTIGDARRGVARTIATAVVSTVGTIWATAGQVVSAGASVVASVSRRVYRNITGTVATVATITDFLYDIVYAMNQTIRQIFAKVRITYTDPYFSAGVVTSADAVGDYTYTDQTVDNVTTEEYKWFSLHRNDLTAAYHPLPGDQSISVGWWGTQLSDFATRVFVPTYPKLTITHAARTIETLLVVGDDQLNEYPVNFTVKLYDAADVLQHTETVTSNGFCTWTQNLSPAHDGIAKQELEITKWSRGDSVCKIAQFFTTLEETYYSEDGDIVSLNVTEQREFSGTTIPQGNLAASEITVKLNNIDGTFDAGNTASPLYGLMLNNRAITAWLGVDLYPSGVRRWYPLGTFYSRDWNAPDSEISVEISGQDMLARLQSTTFSTSEVYESKTLQELAIIIMTDAGLTSADWDIDATLNTITVPYAWFDQVSHRECLRKIAAACMGQCYCNRDGKIVLEVYQAPSLNPFAYTEANTFNFDHPLKWSEMVNYVEAQAMPRTPSAEIDIVTDIESFTVPALGTVTKLHFYTSSPCIDVQAPVIVADPDITVSAYTAYAWGISITYANAGVGDETVTSVTVAGKTLDVVSGRTIVAQDAASISQNGKQTLSSPITSEFWQDETRAQEVADQILEAYKDPRRDIVMRARGNIAQLLGDRVAAVDSWAANTTAHFGIVGQDINYDGGLEIVVTAQRLGTRTDKTLEAVVSTVGTVTRTEPILKTIATATVSAIGSIPRRTGKDLVSTVSTIGTVASVSNPGDFTEKDVGMAGLYQQNVTYNTAWTAVTGLEDPGDWVGQDYISGQYIIQRRQVVVTTEDIPSGATITAAELHFHVSLYNLHTEGGSFDIVIQNGQPTYPHDPLELADYDKSKYSGDGGSIGSGSIVAGGWSTITLNATGRSWIQTGPGAVTKLMLRSSRDIAGTPQGDKSEALLYGPSVPGYEVYLRIWWTP